MKTTAQAAQRLRDNIDKVVTIDETKNEDGTTCLPKAWHVLDKESVFAVMAAIGSERPLLVRGLPGTGKSQLARAVASVLGWEFESKVVDAHTEIGDLFFTFDAVERLAQAQVFGAIHAGKAITAELVRDELDMMCFVRPGPLWRAFDPRGVAAKLSGGEVKHEASAKGHVVLIDEIDKADPSVPNGLLEALGQGTFSVLGRERISLHAKDGPPPLIVITTNEERELPSAFVRRCVVLEIKLPEKDDELRKWLRVRGSAHFPENQRILGLLDKAIEALLTDRKKALERRQPGPGLAEFVDLLTALDNLGDAVELDEIRKAVFEKHLADGR